MKRLEKIWPWLIVLGYIWLRFDFFLRPYNVIWDEAVYIGIAKYMWSFGGSGIWEIIRPPVLPILIGFGWKIGLDVIVWSEFISLAFGIGTLWMTYLFGKELYSRYVGVLAMLLVATSVTYFQYTMRILTGNIAMFFVLLGLYLFIREKYYWAGVSLGMAALSRYPLGLGFGSVILFLGLCWLKDRKINYIETALKVLGGFLIPVIPFLIFNYWFYYNEVSVWWHGAFRPWLLAHGHAWQPSMVEGTYTYYIELLLRTGVWFVGLIPAVFYAKDRDKRERVLWVTLTLLFIYFSWIGNRKERFLLAFLPLVAVFAAKGWDTIMSGKWKQVLVIGILIWAYMVPIPAMEGMINWRPAELPPLMSEYAPFVGQYEGLVLTADPLPIAYTNNKFEPYYFSPNEAKALVEPHLDTAAAVIWTDSAFWCADIDDTCRMTVAELKELLVEGRTLQLNETYFDRHYEIYA